MSRAITLNAVGDISMGDHPVRAGHGMRYAFSKYGASIFAEAAHVLRTGDITLANLETACSDLGLKRYWLPSYEMRGDPKALHYLRDAGINTVSVANNHAMQHGLPAFHDTVKNLRQHDFNVIGRDTATGTTEPYRLTKDGVEVCIAAFSLRPEEWSANQPPYSLRESTASLLKEMARLREATRGFLICSLHWGLEYMEEPSPKQRAIAHHLVDAGVDVVIGHHVHVLQPIEEYRSGLIFYSLGNFVFDLLRPESQLTAITTITLHSGNAPTYELHPFVTDGAFCIREASTDQASHIWGRIETARSLGAVGERSQQAYQKRFADKLKGNRLRKYQYFVRNIRKYPPIFVMQSLARTFIRRLSGK